MKTLRVVDEMDTEVAHLFQRLCERRINNIIPKATVGLDQWELRRLMEAGLITSPTEDREVRFTEVDVGNGDAFLCLYGLDVGVVVLKGQGLPRIFNVSFMRLSEGHAALPAIELTEPGRAISTIVPASEEQAVRMLMEALKKTLGADSVLMCRRKAGTGLWHRVPPSV